jgi:hypothetical protein
VQFRGVLGSHCAAGSCSSVERSYVTYIFAPCSRNIRTSFTFRFAAPSKSRRLSSRPDIGWSTTNEDRLASAVSRAALCSQARPLPDLRGAHAPVRQPAHRDLVQPRSRVQARAESVADRLFPHLRATGAMGPDVPVGFLTSVVTALRIVVLGKAACGFIAAWGLTKHEPWARIVVLVFAFLSLFNVPFGTALGIYTMWVLLPGDSQRECEALAETKAA